MPEGKGTYGSVKGRPPKKKKKKLKKLPKVIGAGQVVQAAMAGKEATRGKSRKQVKKMAGNMLVAGIATDVIGGVLRKAYNKYVDKVNKKRGYK